MQGSFRNSLDLRSQDPLGKSAPLPGHDGKVTELMSLRAEIEHLNKQRDAEQDKIFQLEDEIQALKFRLEEAQAVEEDLRGASSIKSLNANAKVRIKLTPMGEAIWSAYFAECSLPDHLQGKYPNLIPEHLRDKYPEKSPVGGTLELQLWEVMLAFGAYTFLGSEMPFGMNLEIV